MKINIALRGDEEITCTCHQLGLPRVRLTIGDDNTLTVTADRGTMSLIAEHIIKALAETEVGV